MRDSCSDSSGQTKTLQKLRHLWVKWGFSYTKKLHFLYVNVYIYMDLSFLVNHSAVGVGKCRKKYTQSMSIHPGDIDMRISTTLMNIFGQIWHDLASSFHTNGLQLHCALWYGKHTSLKTYPGPKKGFPQNTNQLRVPKGVNTTLRYFTQNLPNKNHRDIGPWWFCNFLWFNQRCYQEFRPLWVLRLEKTTNSRPEITGRSSTVAIERL